MKIADEARKKAKEIEANLAQARALIPHAVPVPSDQAEADSRDDTVAQDTS